ncbi:DUF3991 domain-containing protein [Paenibacillus taiwanensis]|uniref:DUF3991 domain-containing protein n=1 Tax=Paenibacillus taiwanensis TaxID=401638 RepID=UPI000409AF49|nr:DUF3991 domain-containing protein [Paenibacillus taiwanensis]
MSYVSKEQIEQVKQLDLLTYLQMYEPYELARCSRNVYCTRTHDSLKISNGKWFWWSRGFGGHSALDYLIKVRELTFPEAVLALTGPASIERSHRGVQHDTETSSSKEFKLPERSDSNQRVIAYLTSRGIDRSIIDFCLSSGRLYESRPYHNAVFVGYDLQGIPRYAAIRGTSKTEYLNLISKINRLVLHLDNDESGNIIITYEIMKVCGFPNLETASQYVKPTPTPRKNH